MTTTPLVEGNFYYLDLEVIGFLKGEIPDSQGLCYITNTVGILVIREMDNT